MKKDTILLTGATGALGSMLLSRILAEGYQVVCLVRATDSAAAKRRITAIVGDHPGVSVVCGDVTKQNCGISNSDVAFLTGRVNRILHCAASINFTDKAVTQATNVVGVHHVVGLADVLDIWHFMHVSTAYVAGDTNYMREQDSYVSQRWRNAYEESKYAGEALVRGWDHNRDDRRVSIFRPSVLVGNIDGTTPSYDGYYGYFLPMHLVAEALRRHKGILPAGVTISPSGTVHLPIAVVMDTKVVNYVPFDWCADMITRLIGVVPRKKNRTYNLVHDNPLRMRDGLKWSLARLGITGIHAFASQEQKLAAVEMEPPMLQRLQRRIDKVHDAYLPYCTTSPRFQMEAAIEDLGDRFVHPPVIDRAYIDRMLDFALQHDWGRTKTTAQLATVG